jgi:hypothetical protein
MFSRESCRIATEVIASRLDPRLSSWTRSRRPLARARNSLAPARSESEAPDASLRVTRRRSGTVGTRQSSTSPCSVARSHPTPAVPLLVQGSRAADSGVRCPFCLNAAADPTTLLRSGTRCSRASASAWMPSRSRRAVDPIAPWHPSEHASAVVGLYLASERCTVGQVKSGLAEPLLTGRWRLWEVHLRVARATVFERRLLGPRARRLVLMHRIGSLSGFCGSSIRGSDGWGLFFSACGRSRCRWYSPRAP